MRDLGFPKRCRSSHLWGTPSCLGAPQLDPVLGRAKNNERIQTIVRFAGIASQRLCRNGVRRQGRCKECLVHAGLSNRAVRLIEPFGPGGGVDTIARAFAPKLSDLWGQPVTVENHTGAGNTVAPALVAKARPDGYTLLVNSSAQAYTAILRQDLPYDPEKDFIPVAPLTNQGYVLVAGRAAGLRALAELVSRARAKPDALKFGSPGVGSGAHFGVLRFNLEAKIRAVHVPMTRSRLRSHALSQARPITFSHPFLLS